MVAKLVKQGCPLSPKLFNAVVDELMDNLGDRWAFRLRGSPVNIIIFADDILLISGSRLGMDRLLAETDAFFKARGMTINGKKCQSLRMVPARQSKALKIMTGDPLMIDGQPIPEMDCTDSLEYLGVSVTPNGKTKFDLHKVIEWLQIWSRSKLRPHQKMLMLRVHLLPRILFQLTVHLGISKQLLKIVDGWVRRHVKSILHMPPSAPNGVIHGKLSKGGLGILRLADVVPMNRLKSIRRLTDVDDDLIREATGFEFWARHIQRLSHWLKVPPTANQKELEQAAFRLRLAPTIEFAESKISSGYEYVSQNFRASALIGGYVASQGAEYINMVKMLANSLPVRTNTHRGRGGNKICRACGQSAESQNHVLASCPAVNGAIVKRHNQVVSIVGKLSKKAGKTVHVEPRLHSPMGLMKPDLVCVDGGTALVVDVQVPYESSAQYMRRAYEAKKTKYQPIAPWLKHHYRVHEVKFLPLIVGARGSWMRMSSPALRALGIPRSSEGVVSRCALRGSAMVFDTFNKVVMKGRRA